MPADEETLTDPQSESAAGTLLEEPAAAPSETAGEAKEEVFRLSLQAEIEDAGPCRKHVRIRVPQEDISQLYQKEVGELVTTADVPGFRRGHVPKRLVEKRFRQELSDQVKQKVLIASLEQVAEDYDLDPINEPDIDVESIDIPRDGDFEYEFEVEVRPEFELPDYEGLVIKRPVREITDEEVEAFLKQFLTQYGEYETREGPAEPGDYLEMSVRFQHDGRSLHKLHNVRAQIKPVLRFRDAELEGFDELMRGVRAGQSREADLAVSTEAEMVEMRGETVHSEFEVKEVKRLKMPELHKAFLQQIGAESEEELREQVRGMLERQLRFRQREAVRDQVLEKITESADWDLPESLVLRQVDNALRREILEMQQAGFTTQEIRSRENEIRQRAVSTTRQALKEHFVLDKIAENESVQVTPGDIDSEIQLMALQRGESPRRVRARLTKSGMIENLEAQIRERKAVDVVLERAKFKDVPVEPPVASNVEALSHSVCGLRSETVEEESDEEAAGVSPQA